MNFREKISKEQLDALVAFIKAEIEDAKAVKRSQAILLVNDNANSATIKLMTGLKRPVAVKLRKKYIKYGLDALKTKKKTKKFKVLLTRNKKEALVKILNTKKPSDYGYKDQEIWTTLILGDLIKEQWGVEYKSRTSLYLIFKLAKFTFRKPEKQSEKRNQVAIDAWKKEYGPIIEKECARTDTVVLCGDEAAISSETRLQRAWLPKDGPAIIQDTSKRKLAHLYGFLQIGNGVAHAFKTEKQTGEITVRVLKKLAAIYKNKRVVIFWDNASWHKSEEIREYLKTTKQFQLYNFPPYAPDLNPQEHVWKELREKKINNKLITNLDVILKEAIDYIDNTIFNYKFYGAHGTCEV
jgi:transposase